TGVSRGQSEWWYLVKFGLRDWCPAFGVAEDSRAGDRDVLPLGPAASRLEDRALDHVLVLLLDEDPDLGPVLVDRQLVASNEPNIRTVARDRKVLGQVRSRGA